jgi:hypothetical protein
MSFAFVSTLISEGRIYFLIVYVGIIFIRNNNIYNFELKFQPSFVGLFQLSF